MPDVGLQQLWSHVRDGPRPTFRDVCLVIVKLCREAKVGNLGNQALVGLLQEHVAGLEVPMDDLHGVDVVHSGRDALGQAERRLDVLGLSGPMLPVNSASLQSRRQRSARAELLDDPRFPEDDLLRQVAASDLR